MSETYVSQTSEYAILYVDDEEMALKYFLRAVGRDFTVYTATGVDEGLAILAECGDAIGVLITDQRMPGQSGVDLLKKVRDGWPHIVRLLTTAYADLDDAIEAVNSGEIFRYITKPWDIKALRAEIGQAMNVFRLQHEHAQLMREKLSVWQRLVQLGRVRDLVVMAGSFPHLRHSDNAVAAYLTDHLAPDSLALSQYLDFWQLTGAEISQTLEFAQDILARTAQVTSRDERFETTLAADRLLSLGGSAFAGADVADGDALPEIRVAEEPAALLFQELAALVGGQSGDGIQLQAVANGAAVSVSVSAPANDTVGAGLTTREAAGLLTAYLLAFHHGGSLKLAPNPKTYVLTLPARPDEVSLPPPRTGWLESLLVRLEGWD